LRSGVVALLVASAAAAAPSEPATTAPSAGRAVLRRLVRHFDFEDRERTPETFPMSWYRYGKSVSGRHDGTSAEGFATIGDMALADDHASRGRWSFRFDLAGGSMAARVAGGVLPVMPRVDYRVRTMVRTEGLVHARVRLAAWLEDHHGSLIEGSFATSDAIRTGGDWEAMSVAIDGVHPEATQLRVALQLLQPRHLPGALRPGVPIPQDVSGRAWFDEVAIWSVPRVSIATGAPGNVIDAGDRPALTVTVDDLVSDGVAAGISITDLDDWVVHRESVTPAAASAGCRVDLAALPLGWYRIAVDLHESGRTIARHETSFVLQHDNASEDRAGAFGVAIDALSPVDLAMVDRAGGGTVVVTVAPPTDDDGEAVLAALAALLDGTRRVVLDIDETPDRIAALVSRGEDAVTTERDAAFARLIDGIVLRFGARIDRWRLKDAGPGPRSLAPILPSLRLVRSWPAEAEPPRDGAWSGHHVHVPWQLSSHAIGELAAAWSAVEPDALWTLELPPAELYGPRDRVIDLVRRGLALWRAGARPAVIDAPWRAAPGTTGPLRPDPTLPAWRELGARLDGRRFGGELDIGPGRHAWLLLGPGPHDGAVVAWAEPVTAEGIAPLRMYLGADPVRVIDAFGNERRVAEVNGRHDIELSPTPSFILGIDPELAAFRATFAFEPTILPTANRRLPATVVVHNPWDVSVTGTARFSGDEPWRIAPRVLDISLDPGETARLPITIVPTRGLVEGQRTIAAEFELLGRRSYRFTAEAPVHVGLPGIEVLRSWRLVRSETSGRTDLEIRLQVTNDSGAPRSLEAFVRATGMGTERRPIGLLEPGQTAFRTVRIPGGATIYSGRVIRVGVDDRERSARLTQELRLPVFDSSVAIGGERPSD
jgi:hypothetical protein